MKHDKIHIKFVINISSQQVATTSTTPATASSATSSIAEREDFELCQENFSFLLNTPLNFYIDEWGSDEFNYEYFQLHLHLCCTSINQFQDVIQTIIESNPSFSQEPTIRRIRSSFLFRLAFNVGRIMNVLRNLTSLYKF